MQGGGVWSTSPRRRGSNGTARAASSPQNPSLAAAAPQQLSDRCRSRPGQRSTSTGATDTNDLANRARGMNGLPLSASVGAFCDSALLSPAQRNLARERIAGSSPGAAQRPPWHQAGDAPPLQAPPQLRPLRPADPTGADLQMPSPLGTPRASHPLPEVTRPSTPRAAAPQETERPSRPASAGPSRAEPAAPARAVQRPASAGSRRPAGTALALSQSIRTLPQQQGGDSATEPQAEPVQHDDVDSPGSGDEELAPDDVLVLSFSSGDAADPADGGEQQQGHVARLRQLAHVKRVAELRNVSGPVLDGRQPLLDAQLRRGGAAHAARRAGRRAPGKAAGATVVHPARS
eukprot:TRINITY_DN8511_c0_g1_i2.p1 TRINITY_DN8511_c0_g1~~TRINITY_DN8511_c0_g1_i2.p1  ORF type:complete len:347 (+),score=47.89 TRINITY_DN8511_c0_g1_i2:207-1247(+)